MEGGDDVVELQDEKAFSYDIFKRIVLETYC